MIYEYGLSSSHCSSYQYSSHSSSDFSCTCSYSASDFGFSVSHLSSTFESKHELDISDSIDRFGFSVNSLSHTSKRDTSAEESVLWYPPSKSNVYHDPPSDSWPHY